MDKVQFARDSSSSQSGLGMIQAVTPEVNVTTQFLIHLKFGEYPLVLTCSYCKQITTTRVVKANKCARFFWFCCCLTGCCQKRIHECGNCGNYLGTSDSTGVDTCPVKGVFALLLLVALVVIFFLRR